MAETSPAFALDDVDLPRACEGEKIGLGLRAGFDAVPEKFGHWLGIRRGGRVRNNEARVGLEGHNHMRAKMGLREPVGKGLAK